ncbi:ImmA/IrrE family metallo-endopeptidase [Halobacillus seohaensis]|uniref:ImmA/IrrE family metallo-endopeptidase n=1 Tax=Halobacillus seohaensis TaxID=447421 RepID=A0ABW2EST9_9BACI
MGVKKKVDSLIRKHNTNCRFQIAEKIGIQVQFEPLGEILGYYSRHFRIPFIHINENIGEDQIGFVCGHELGHATLHPKSNTPFLKKHTYYSTHKIEREANGFAVELLIPDEDLDDFKDHNITIYEAANMYGIPKDLVQLKTVEKFDKKI